MNIKEVVNIDFEIQLQSSGSKNTPNINTIDQFRPDADAIATCQKWLSSRGVTCYATDFSLVCNAPKELVESLFSTKIGPGKSEPGLPKWRFLTSPVPPPEIAELIEHMEITAKPELF